MGAATLVGAFQTGGCVTERLLLLAALAEAEGGPKEMLTNADVLHILLNWTLLTWVVLDWTLRRGTFTVQLSK